MDEHVFASQYLKTAAKCLQQKKITPTLRESPRAAELRKAPFGTPPLDTEG